MSSACELPLAQRVPNYHTIAGLPLSVSAKRHYAESLQRGTPEFRQALAGAHRLGRRALWICNRFPTENALALREFGEICRLQGKHQKAMRYFDKSSNVAKSQAESYELAKTNLAKAKLAQEMGLPESAVMLSEAQAEMQRFDAMIAEGLARIQ
jgi:tetratricopeptide (TPR) repeat protein